VPRSGATCVDMRGEGQPLPKLGPSRAELGGMLTTNEAKSARERLTMIRLSRAARPWLRSRYTRSVFMPERDARLAVRRSVEPMSVEFHAWRSFRSHRHHQLTFASGLRSSARQNEGVDARQFLFLGIDGVSRMPSAEHGRPDQ